MSGIYPSTAMAWFSAVLAICVAVLLGVPVGVAAQTNDRYSISSDGGEVIDDQAKLIWTRCLIGMKLQGGRCQGQPQLFPASLIALKIDELNKETGKKWRLPSMAELRLLVSVKHADYDKVGAIDPKAFPGTPISRVWTTQSTGAHYLHWVSFMDGSTGESPRSTPIAIRLVREP
jgi:hypothetical protein